MMQIHWRSLMPIRLRLLTLTDLSSLRQIGLHSLKRIRWSLQTQTD